VPIPKLGQLKELPQEESADGAKFASNEVAPDSASLKRAAFALLGVIATLSVLICGFCTVRWYLIDVPQTTEQHLAKFEREYKKLKPAELIREYEQMERYGLDMPIPFNYKLIQVEKQAWGQNAAVAGAVAGVAMLIAFLLALLGGQKRDPASGHLG
jgi:hypothetical protein